MAVMGEPAALQRPDAVVHARAVQEDDERLGRVGSRPPVAANTLRPSTSSCIARSSGFLRGAQRLFEIGDDVVGGLEPDRQPHHVLADAGRGELRRRSSADASCVAGWMTSVLASPTLARWLASFSASMNLRPAGASALDAEADDRARAARQQTLRQLVIGVARQRGMGDPADRRVGAERREHGRGVLDMALHAQRQRLDARSAVAPRCAARGRRRNRASPRSRARMMKAGGPNSLGEDEAVIAGVGLGQRRVTARGAPIEPAAVDDRAADHERRGRRSIWSANA